MGGPCCSFLVCVAQTTHLSGGIGSALDRLLLRHPMVDNDSPGHLPTLAGHSSEPAWRCGVHLRSPLASLPPRETQLCRSCPQSVLSRGEVLHPMSSSPSWYAGSMLLVTSVNSRLLYGPGGVSSPSTTNAACALPNSEALKSTQGGNVHVLFATMQSLCKILSLPVPFLLAHQ